MKAIYENVYICGTCGEEFEKKEYLIKHFGEKSKNINSMIIVKKRKIIQ